MRKAIVILLAIFFFLVCILLAFFSNESPPSLKRTTPTPTNIPGAIQRTIIFVHADDLTSAAPKLASLWVMTYLSDPAQMNLVMLYPTADKDARTLDLPKNFGLDTKGRLSAEFTAAIAAYKFDYEGYFLVDNAALIQAINLLDKSLKMTPRGETLIAGLPMPWDDLDLSMTIQQSLAADLCDELSRVPFHLNLNYLWNNTMPTHLRTDLSIEAWESFWKLAMSDKNRFTCKILVPR